VVIVELVGERRRRRETVIPHVVAIVLVRGMELIRAAVLALVGREDCCARGKDRLGVAPMIRLGGTVPLKVHILSGP